MTRRTGTVAGLLASAVLAGCGGGAAAASSSTPTAPLQYSPTTTTRPPAAAVVDVPGAPRCTTGEMKVVTALPTVARGSVFFEVVVGAPARRCSVDGYPTLRLFGHQGGRVVPLPVVTARERPTGAVPLGEAPSRLDVGPRSGDTVAFLVRIPDSPAAGRCRAVEGFAFSAPGGATGADVDLAGATSGPTDDVGTVSVCGGTVLVTPFEVPDIPDISG